MPEAASSPGPTAGSADAPDLTGRTFGDFLIVRRLGRGGMGQVYLARQLSLKREVALKVLRPDTSNGEVARKRFQAEAEAVARLRHPNIVQIYQIGEQDGLRYMVLEYVAGRNLRDYLDRKGPPELPVCLSIIRQVAAALQRAHEEGIVHRDIKPENILVTRRVEVKVADFGLSRFFTRPEALNLTQSGVTVGTPLYMSPEQVQGQPVDHRSDIYSLGVTCYHLLAGEPPFQGKTAFEVALKHVQESPPPLASRRPDLPPELVAMVERMMAKSPAERYPSVREIIRDLNRIRERPAASLQLSGATPSLIAPLATGPSAAAAAPATAPADPAGPTPPPPPVGALTAVAGSPPVASRRRRWLLVGLVLLGGVGVGGGMALFRPSAAPPQPTSPVADAAAGLPDIAWPEPLLSRRERELLAAIDSRTTRPDEIIAASIELAVLYVRQRRLDEADRRFAQLEREQFDKQPLPKLDKGLPLTRAAQLAGQLGRAAVAAFRPDADPHKVNERILKILDSAVVPGGPPFGPKVGKTDRYDRAYAMVSTLVVRYPDLGELLAEALDRNAAALNLASLTPPVLEQLRRPPRLGKRD